MAQKIAVRSFDDIDGSEADEQVRFALDGVAFEIDLSERNAERLRETLSRFVHAARRVGGRKQYRPKAAGQSRERSQQIRAWARKNGWEVADRGRLPADLVEAYEKAGKAARGR